MTALIKLYKTDHAALITWVKKCFGLGENISALNAHRLRREAIGQRLRLYRDDGRVDFERIISTVFATADVITDRQKMIDVACEQNVTARIVDEVASLYDTPAVRTLKDKAKTEALRQHAIDIELDETMQEAHRLAFLCNEVLLWQTTALEDGERAQLNIVTPDVFDVIADPRAPKTRPAGYLFQVPPASIADDVSMLPHYEIWDDTFRYQLNKEGNLCNDDGMLVTAPIEHGLSRIPGVLWHRRKPVDRILDQRHGRDIITAHLGVGLLSVMIMQLAKSQGERQPILRGNLANVAKNQSMTGEGPIALPPEVDAFMLDTKTDATHYLDMKKDKLGGVAHRYGMSYESLTYAAVPTSGKDWQARRGKLLELRGEQKLRGHVHERGTVKLMGYEVEGMRTDYQEQAMPEDAREKLDLLRELMKLGLASPVDYARWHNPDLTHDEAVAWMKKNLADYAALIVWIRALNIPAEGDASNPGKTPEQNGADNAKKGDDAEDKTNEEADGQPEQLAS
jgi:hypothetical protein